ncbi:hypothetical protein [Piscinibacterium candidicorallinum]|jgi:hypothetical protein|uniref:Outer membrane protein beta-barrel domain-containing protein n=1 Tax=Piscinibacterium candidicorallinum TaxID=1793872 RepID=A0ABV7H8P0_9BURK
MRSTTLALSALATALLVGASFSAHAGGIGVRAGTNGVGGDIGWDVLPTLKARLGYSAGKTNFTVDDTSINYDGKLKLSQPALFLDFTPLGPFRITAGLIGSGSKVQVTGKPSGGNYVINGVTYSAAQIGTVTGELRAKNSLSPYLGVGYGNVSGLGVNFYVDLGVQATGGAKATVNASCGSLSAADCNTLRSNLNAEAARLAGSNSLKYYPVASIGVTVGF